MFLYVKIPKKSKCVHVYKFAIAIHKYWINLSIYNPIDKVCAWVSNAWLLIDHPCNVNWWKWFTNVVLIHHGWGKVSLYMMIISIYIPILSCCHTYALQIVLLLFCYLCCHGSELGISWAVSQLTCGVLLWGPGWPKTG